MLASPGTTARCAGTDPQMPPLPGALRPHVRPLPATARAMPRAPRRGAPAGIADHARPRAARRRRSRAGGTRRGPAAEGRARPRARRPQPAPGPPSRDRPSPRGRPERTACRRAQCSADRRPPDREAWRHRQSRRRPRRGKRPPLPKPNHAIGRRMLVEMRPTAESPEPPRRTPARVPGPVVAYRERRGAGRPMAGKRPSTRVRVWNLWGSRPCPLLP